MKNKIPLFYSNLPDDNHCLQACVMSVLNSLGHKISWEEVNIATYYEDGKYSWIPECVLFLNSKIPQTQIIDQLDYKRFAKEGENYLKEYMKPQWFELQKKYASLHFKKEQQAARKLIDKNLFKHQKQLRIKTLENLLNDHWIIAIVDSGKMRGESYNAGHLVLLYGQDKDNFYLHDPGLPPIESWKVEKKLFKKCFQNGLISIPV